MVEKIFKSIILLICVILLMGCSGESKQSLLNVTANEENIIREYLNNNPITTGDTEVNSAFKILGTGKDEIYLWVLQDNKIGEGASVPVLLKTKKDNNKLEILSLNTPGDGDAYKDDVKKLFPKSVDKEIFGNTSDHNAIIEQLQKQLEEIKVKA